MANTRNDNVLKEKFISALEFSAPSILEMERSDPDQKMLDTYHAFKTIAMRYHQPITIDVLKWLTKMVPKAQHIFSFWQVNSDIKNIRGNTSKIIKNRIG